MIRFVLVSLMLLSGLAARAEPLRMAVTTSFENSGLADVLVPVIRAETGINVQLVVVGTGQALRLGRAGDVDAVLVHSREAEEAFVAAGFATHRRQIMFNDFVLIGPTSDPANIAAATTVRQALTRISAAHAPFVSRGDDSGTHRREVTLWDRAGIPNRAPAWYHEAGGGMGATLNTAVGLSAYVLSDRASWLNFGNQSGARILFSGDPALFNQYAFLPVNPERHAHVDPQLTARLEAWLTSPRACALIDGYRIKGEALFTFNAR